MRHFEVAVWVVTACAFAFPIGATLGCSSNCKKEIEEVRVFVEVDSREEWLSDSYDLLKECRDYCDGYADVRDCRFVQFIPSRDSAGDGGVGGGGGGGLASGMIETNCTANTTDSCE